MWDAIKARHLGADRVREARLQTLTAEFDRLTMKEADSIDDFAGKLSGLASKSAALGQVMEESKLVKKFLKSLPRQKYIQITASLEQVLDLNTTGFEDIVGRLKAYEERIRDEEQQNDCEDRLMFVGTDRGGKGQDCGGQGNGRESHQSRDQATEGSSSKHRTTRKQKKDHSKVICFRCDKAGHFASKCPERMQKIQETNLAETYEADAALFVHEIVFLNEQNVIPKKYEVELKEEDTWYLDNGASNHMTGNVSYFSELNSKMSGKVRFGDGSCIDIKGKGSILIQGKDGEQRLITDIYYIPELKSNILSLGQVTENGCEVKMKGDYLTMYDQNEILLMKVMRSPNRLYKVQLKIVTPSCLLSILENEAWRWHARLGHIGFDAVKSMRKMNMVNGSLVEVENKICESCLVGWNWNGFVTIEASEPGMFRLICVTSVDTGAGPIVFDTSIEEEEIVSSVGTTDSLSEHASPAASVHSATSSSHGSASSSNHHSSQNTVQNVEQVTQQLYLGLEVHRYKSGITKEQEGYAGTILKDVDLEKWNDTKEGGNNDSGNFTMVWGMSLDYGAWQYLVEEESPDMSYEEDMEVTEAIGEFLLCEEDNREIVGTREELFHRSDESTLRRTTRETSKPKYLEHYVLFSDIKGEELLLSINGELNSYLEAEDSTEWMEEMEFKIESIHKNIMGSLWTNQ